MDVDGEIFQHLEYLPFGETFVEEASNTQRTPYLFTAKELDEETGLYNFGARYYDPRTSVWQSTDPILSEYLVADSESGVFVPANLSVYAYTHNRPLVATDPDGNWVNFIVGGIKGAVVNVVVQRAEMAVGLRDEFSWGELAVDVAIDTATSGTGGTAKATARMARVAAAARKADRAEDAVSTAKTAERVENGVDAAKPTRTGAKRGPKTDPDAPHNRKIREEAQKIVDEGGTILSGGGGKERLVPTPGGHKSGRRPDIEFRDSCGVVRGCNVGRTQADGRPVKREREALEDLNGSGELPTYFVPYD